ncbi:hypothetical protein NMG60_11031559 [Bertholletia excelsa]
MNFWSGQGLDEAAPSNGIRPVGLGKLQMMMRQLVAVGETYTQTAHEDASWSFWPMNPSQASTSRSHIPHSGSLRLPGTASGLHTRTFSLPVNDNIANVLGMAEKVWEVFPHIPDELIFHV